MKEKHIFTTALVITALSLTGCGSDGFSDYVKGIQGTQASSESETTTEVMTSEDTMEVTTTEETVTTEEPTTTEEPATTEEPTTTEKPISGGETAEAADKAFAEYLSGIAANTTFDNMNVTMDYTYKYKNGDEYNSYTLYKTQFDTYAIGDFDYDGTDELMLNYYAEDANGAIDALSGFYLYEYDSSTGEVICDTNKFIRVDSTIFGSDGGVNTKIQFYQNGIAAIWNYGSEVPDIGCFNKPDYAKLKVFDGADTTYWDVATFTKNGDEYDIYWIEGQGACVYKTISSDECDEMIQQLDSFEKLDAELCIFSKHNIDTLVGEYGINGNQTAGTESTGGYVFPNSDSVYLTKSDLTGLSKDVIMYARNEIYARHGRKFKDSEIQAYFNGCSWYSGTVEPDEFDDSVFNAYEKANLDLIVEYEKEMGYR